MYKIELTKSAEKGIKSIAKSAIKRVSSKIDSLAENPRPQGSKKLKGEELWRVRIGNYRVVYFIKDIVKIVEIVRIGHRKDIYQK